jgi:hypothetical protein
VVGHRFGELAYLFPDGIVMGLVDRISGKARCGAVLENALS